MDFGKAALLIASVFGIAQLMKSLVPDKWASNPRTMTLLLLAASFLATFGVAATVWADQQVIGGVAMSDLTTIDKIVVALLLAGTSGFTEKVFKSVNDFSNGKTKETVVIEPPPLPFPSTPVVSEGGPGA